MAPKILKPIYLETEATQHGHAKNYGLIY